MDANFRVFVRCRADPQGENGKFSIEGDHKINKIELDSSVKSYQYDGVFDGSVQQQNISEICAMPLVNDFVLGKNATIFAYGQTGTGKTHTIAGDTSFVLGKPNSQSEPQLSEQAGLIPRVLEALFLKLKAEPDCSLEMTYVEIYNEQFYDLLDNNTRADTNERVSFGVKAGATSSFSSSSSSSSSSASSPAAMAVSSSALTNSLSNSKPSLGSKRISVQENPRTRSIELNGATSRSITSLDSALAIYKQASERRATASTLLNKSSSRSHAVLTLTLLSKDNATGKVIRSKLHLVDLAGSENVGKSGAVRQRAQEAGQINKSLLNLGRVIETKIQQQKTGQPKHIPYRESKLTHLLQDCLGGFTKTYMIATISLSAKNDEETKSTLEYAWHARSIRNPPQVTYDVNEMQSTLRCLARQKETLERELMTQRTRENAVFLTIDDFKRLKSKERQLPELKLRINTMQRQHDADKQILRNQYNVESTNLQNKFKLAEEQFLQQSSMFEQLNSENSALRSQLESRSQVERSISVAKPVFFKFVDTLQRIGSGLTDAMAPVPAELRDLAQRMQAQVERAEHNSIAALEQKLVETLHDNLAIGMKVFDSTDIHDYTQKVLQEYRSQVTEIWQQSAEAQNQHLLQTQGVCKELITELQATIPELENLRKREKERVELIEQVSKDNEVMFQMMVKLRQGNAQKMRRLQELGIDESLSKLESGNNAGVTLSTQVHDSLKSSSSAGIEAPSIDDGAERLFSAIQSTASTAMDNVTQSHEKNVAALLGSFESDRLHSEQQAFSTLSAKANILSQRIDPALNIYKTSFSEAVDSRESMFTNMWSQPSEPVLSVRSPARNHMRSPVRSPHKNTTRSPTKAIREPLLRDTDKVVMGPPLHSPNRPRLRNMRSVSPLGSPIRTSKRSVVDNQTSTSAGSSAGSSAGGSVASIRVPLQAYNANAPIFPQDLAAPEATDNNLKGATSPVKFNSLEFSSKNTLFEKASLDPENNPKLKIMGGSKRVYPASQTSPNRPTSKRSRP